MLVAERRVAGPRPDGGGQLEPARRRAARRAVAARVVDQAARNRRRPGRRPGERDPIAESDLATSAVEHVRELTAAPGDEVAVDERALADRDTLPARGADRGGVTRESFRERSSGRRRTATTSLQSTLTYPDSVRLNRHAPNPIG